MIEKRMSGTGFNDMVSEAEQMIDRRNPQALDLATRLNAAAIASGNPADYAQASYIMAFYSCLVTNNYDYAIQLCQDALVKVNFSDINEVSYKVYMTLGNAYQLKGEVFSAQQWYLKGLKQLESRKVLSDKEKGFMASFYYNLSLVLNETELKISAGEYLEKAIHIYEELGAAFTFKLSKSYSAYASLLEQKKEFNAAIEMMGKALQLDEIMNEPYGIALSKANLGILYNHVHNTRQAFNFLKEALDYFEGKNLNVESAMVKAKLGEVSFAIGKKNEALNYLFAAEKLFFALDNKRELCSAYEMIARYLEEAGDIKLALQYQHKYIDSLKQFFDVEKTNALTRAKKEFETELKEKESNILRQKNEEIHHYVLKLERSNKELKQFAHVASHDLREPLRMITSYITLLKKSLHNSLSPQQTEFVEFISDAGRRMDQLIADLLRLAKVDANPRTEVVRLKSVVEEIKLNLEVLITEKNAVVICADLPEITGDRTMILQLFQNIMSNGIKYNESAKPAVIINHLFTHAGLEISITDNGIGIPEHQREKAFEIFNRLHTSKEYPGSGIGLAICKKIVESMEGKISIEDNPTGGTVFKMVFPDSIVMHK